VTDRGDQTSREILAGLNVRALPTLIFITGEGTQLAPLVGEQSSAKVIEVAKKARGG
jgi:thiol:disulfide interchange protein